ncbi:DNA-binding transcriptional ArsR family regulator [Haloactinospora alba]|uniref:DNA-binding transcriptional ArsR family regulator n=1 Tax=Haloactinospora alba TaxID=405555 RepID=A0A543NN67_9ACTN|nr:metalloregulator ArsR/SmtB family transcription factor [Haloactinospora alba]TQN33237.1 DNA-binding transcriptional ArsR family regulator [Haloactinospora alba]
MSEPGEAHDPTAHPAGVCGGQTPVELDETTHEFLRALASPTRQRIMLLFAQGAELSVGEVAERTGLGQSTVSEQLALLRRGGILASRREGKTVLYHSDRERVSHALADLQNYLRFCC